MEGALPFRVEHPGPLRRARAGGEPRQVPLDGDTQLLPIALGSLCERDGAAGSGREQSSLDRVPAADEPILEGELRLPEGEQRRTAEQLQLASAARPARTDDAARGALDRLPVGDTEGAGARLRRLDRRLHHEHPLARLEGAGLEDALRCLPARHAATAIGEGYYPATDSGPSPAARHLCPLFSQCSLGPTRSSAIARSMRSVIKEPVATRRPSKPLAAPIGSPPSGVRPTSAVLTMRSQPTSIPGGVPR